MSAAQSEFYKVQEWSHMHITARHGNLAHVQETNITIVHIQFVLTDVATQLYHCRPATAAIRSSYVQAETESLPWTSRSATIRTRPSSNSLLRGELVCVFRRRLNIKPNPMNRCLPGVHGATSMSASTGMTAQRWSAWRLRLRCRERQGEPAVLTCI